MVWFGENERATVTSIGVAMNIFGVAVGFLQPSHMVPDTYNMKEVSFNSATRVLSSFSLC